MKINFNELKKVVNSPKLAMEYIESLETEYIKEALNDLWASSVLLDDDGFRSTRTLMGVSSTYVLSYLTDLVKECGYDKVNQVCLDLLDEKLNQESLDATEVLINED